MCMSFIKLLEMKGTLERRILKCALNTEFRERVLFATKAFLISCGNSEWKREWL